MLPCSPKLEVREAIYHMCKNALASNKLFEAYAHRLISAKNGVAALRQEAFRADRHFSNASNKLFEAYAHRIISAKNGAAALRQEAFRADRHFSNASNKMFEAIIPQKRPAYNAALWEEKKGAIHYEDTQKKRLRATIYGSQTLFQGDCFGMHGSEQQRVSTPWRRCSPFVH